jgi:two-component system, OmpR family, phosphate regulon sensor histidine kinase PhoR
MQALVDDLLDLSRIESGAWTPEPMTLDLAAVARDVWTTFDRRPEETGVDLALEVPVDLKVQADPNALRQILRNLLDNALRYGPPGTSVTVSAAPEKGGVRIVVADAGSGIPTDHLERVFERFYRVDAARSREAGGTGLGLSIVKHLVAAHGGDIGIESEVGEGTRVWFLLPADNSA